MHLTDEQLNEYLDHETTERVQIESHLAGCADCAARLTALKTLFAEIESLPEIALSYSFTAPFTHRPGPTAQLPRWLTLTATLQIALALIVFFIAAPFIAVLIPPIETPSTTDLLIRLQSHRTVWLNLLSSFQLPALPQIPVLEIPSLMLTLTLVSASILWLVGNGLLLRKPVK